MLKNQKGFAPVITLLFVAFVLTSYVAVKSQNQMVLGEEDIKVEEERNEIKEVKVREIKSKLERTVSNEGKRNEVEVRNEGGKVKLKIQEREREFEYEDGSLKLKIKESSPSGEKDNEIEDEDDNEKDVTIKPSDDDEMEIEDGGRRVRTNFPITVNQEDGTISVTTPNGEVKVKELPSTAIDNMIENGLFNTVSDVSIEESSDGQTDAVLNVNGEKTYKFLGVLPVKAKVRAEVDQETGDISKLNTPWFISTFGFLFSK